MSSTVKRNILGERLQTSRGPAVGNGPNCPIPRVLHLLGSAQLEWTGIAKIVAALFQHVDASRYQAEALFVCEPGPLQALLESTGMRVRSMRWNRRTWDLAGALGFVHALRRKQPSIVHFHFGGRSATSAVRIASRAKVVMHLHSQVNEETGSAPTRVKAGADVVIAVSRAVADRVQHPNVRVVYSGVELSDLRQRRDGLIVGTAGRLVALKGTATLLHAAALLKSDFPRLRIEIAGEGSERETLERLAGGLGIGNQVQFLGWQTRIEDLLGRWDVFALPSLAEGLGLACLEAMAAGLPVIASQVGGVSEAVKDGLNGILVPAGDRHALAIGLRKLLENVEMRRAMGEAGRRIAAQRFSAAIMARQVTEIYDWLLAGQ